jgi:hypothetical protein
MAVSTPLFEVTGEIRKGKKKYSILNTVSYFYDERGRLRKKIDPEPSVHSEITRSKKELITDPEIIYQQTKKKKEDPKGRCPYCTYITTGNNVATLASVVSRAYGQIPRKIETSRWCPACNRTFVKRKVVSAEY